MFLVAAPGDARPLTVEAQKKATEAPIAPDEWGVRTQTIGTTPVHLFSTDPSTVSSLFVQNLRVTNRSASNGVCVSFHTLVTDCATTCGASGITCSGTGTDGDYLAPSSTYPPIAITGRMCACAVASAASTVVTAARIQRGAE